MKLVKSVTGQAVKAADGGTAQVVIATTNVVDADGDVVVPGAIGAQTVVLLPSHDARSIPLGKASTFERGGEVLADLAFNLAIPAARDWHAALKWDVEHPPALQEYSWGYEAKRRPGRLGDRPVSFLEDVTIFEVSMVLRGASVGTGTVAVKEHDLDAAERAELRRIAAQVKASEFEKRRELAEIRAKFFADRAVESDAADVRFVTGRSFLPVGESSVAPRLVGAARATVKLAAAHLGVATPEVRWFRQEPFTLYGRARASLGVLLNADLSVRDVVVTAAHEVAHLAGRDERGARRYESEFVEEVFNGERRTR